MLTHAVEFGALDPVPDPIAKKVVEMADAVELDPRAALVNQLVARHAQWALDEFGANHR